MQVRYVEPYIFTHMTHAKGRWLNREILEVVTTEFGSHPRWYWEQAISTGAVRVNDAVVTVDYRFKGGDLFTHRTHRHEPPVKGEVSRLVPVDTFMPMHRMHMRWYFW